MKDKFSVVILVLLAMAFVILLSVLAVSEKQTDQNIIKNVTKEALNGSFLTEKSEVVQKAFDSEITGFDVKKTLGFILHKTCRVISFENGRILVINKEGKVVEFIGEFPFFKKAEINNKDWIRALLFDD